jgi:hypothetical protein
MASGPTLTLIKLKSEDLPYFQDYSPEKFENFNLEN